MRTSRPAARVRLLRGPGLRGSFAVRCFSWDSWAQVKRRWHGALREPAVSRRWIWTRTSSVGKEASRDLRRIGRGRLPRHRDRRASRACRQRPPAGFMRRRGGEARKKSRHLARCRVCRVPQGDGRRGGNRASATRPPARCSKTSSPLAKRRRSACPCTLKSPTLPSTLLGKALQLSPARCKLRLRRRASCACNESSGQPCG